MPRSIDDGRSPLRKLVSDLLRPSGRQQFVAGTLDYQHRNPDALVGPFARRRRWQCRTRPPEPGCGERLPRPGGDTGLIAPLDVVLVSWIFRIVEERLDDPSHGRHRCVVVVQRLHVLVALDFAAAANGP